MQSSINISPGKQPLVSIIIVVYNAVELLEKSILSITNQNYKNTELIIIDGGSTDGTISVIKKYSGKIAYWISEQDKGVYDAMNKGIKVATGNYVYFLGAGDELLNVLDIIAQKLVNENTIYYGNVYRNDTLKMYNGKFSAFKLVINNICHQAIFYPSNVFKKFEYNVKYKTHADHDLNMKCYGDKDINFEYVPLTVSIYDGDGMSATNIDLPFYKDKLVIIKTNFSTIVYFYAFTRNKVARLLKRNTY